MDTRPLVPGTQIVERRSPQIDVGTVVQAAQEGASVVAGLLSFISQLAHTFGHVNHPLFIDKLVKALSHAKDLDAALRDVGFLASQLPAPGTPPVPIAGDTP